MPNSDCACTALYTNPGCPRCGAKWIQHLVNRRPRLALCVMVKNEAKTLPRLLDSCKGFIDHVIAFDTGSTDDTVDILESVGADILRGTFEDFGRSRTKLMEFARGKADWLLLMDADQLLRKEVSEIHLDRAYDSFLIEHSGLLSYRVTRLVSGDVPWCYVGSTHEYLARKDGARGASANLDGLKIGHRADGGSRADKFERDERLLRADLEKDPANGRTVFYLANTLRDLGRPDEAREYYAQRAKMGGWDEEVFVALLEAAKISQDPVEFWEAWAARPTRAEPLFYLEKAYRARGALGDPTLAEQVQKLRETIVVPKDVLFVELPCYLVPKPFWMTIPGWCDFIGFYEKMANRMPKPTRDNPLGSCTFVEVGVYLGSSFACFDSFVNKKLGLDCEMIAVDTFSPVDPKEQECAPSAMRQQFIDNMAKAGVEDFTLLEMPSEQAARNVAVGSVDFVFLDGDHSYGAVLVDISAWAPTVRPGGYIGGHDYDREEVKRAVADAFGPNREIEVSGRCWVVQVPAQ